MKSQFDPDVWAALLMIMIIGFGGITFMSMFVNGFTMHGLLSIFDQEYNQRCEYFLLPATSNDYAEVYDSPDEHMKDMKDYFWVNEPRKTSYFDDIMEGVKNEIYKHHHWIDLGGGTKAKAVCWAMGNSSYVDEKIDKCLKNYRAYKIVVMSCGTIVYGPSGIGSAQVVFVG